MRRLVVLLTVLGLLAMGAGVASAGITAALSGLRGRTARLLVALTLLSSLVLVQVPWFAAPLHLKPLHLDDWLIAIGGGLLAALIPFVASLRHRAPHRL